MASSAVRVGPMTASRLDIPAWILVLWIPVVVVIVFLVPGPPLEPTASCGPARPWRTSRRCIRRTWPPGCLILWPCGDGVRWAGAWLGELARRTGLVMSMLGVLQIPLGLLKPPFVYGLPFLPIGVALLCGTGEARGARGLSAAGS